MATKTKPAAEPEMTISKDEAEVLYESLGGPVERLCVEIAKRFSYIDRQAGELAGYLWVDIPAARKELAVIERLMKRREVLNDYIGERE